MIRHSRARILLRIHRRSTRKAESGRYRLSFSKSRDVPLTRTQTQDPFVRQRLLQHVRSSKTPGTRTLGILLWKKIALEGGQPLTVGRRAFTTRLGKIRPYLLADVSLFSLIHSDTTESLTSRRGSVGSRALRAHLDPFGTETGHAPSHLEQSAPSAGEISRTVSESEEDAVHPSRRRRVPQCTEWPI